MQQDNVRQDGELRQALLNHLPNRLENVRRRGVRLCQQGWDINMLALLLREIKIVAGISGRLGLVDLTEHLQSIEVFLGDFVKRVALPDLQQTERAAALLNDLDSLILRHTPNDGYGEALPSVTLIGATPLSGNVYPMQVIPPPGYWRRFDALPAETKQATSVTSAPPRPAPLPAVVSPSEPIAERKVEVTATPVPPAVHSDLAATRSRELRRAYHLSDGGSFSRELDQNLENAGYELTLLENVDELTEMLAMYAPHLVLVDATFMAVIDKVGELIKANRAQLTRPLALLAFSDSTELTVRLHAMRAGIDALIALPTQASEVMARIADLLETDTADPFRVLIVEDDRTQAMFAESILRKAGMDARAETDSLAALNRLDEFHPDLILMDLHMPNCDGLELTSIIREREAFISTPIVFLSGEHDEEKHFEALNVGGDDFLSKPIQPKHLISAVTNRVRRARQIQRRTTQAQAHNLRDSNSGLYELNYVLDQLNAHLAADLGPQPTGGVMCIEIDAASQLRETIGLAAFEALVNQLGAFIAKYAANDQAIRYSDCSFLVLNIDKSADELQSLGGKLLESTAEQTFTHKDKKLKFDLVCGICAFSEGKNEAGAVINAAERAVDDARALKEKRVVLSRQGSQSNPDRVLAKLVRSALKAGGLQLVFQPIVALRGDDEEQFQTLLRMNGEGGRVYTAAEIIPVAEREDLIGEIDRWVLSRCVLVMTERTRQKRPVRLFVSQHGQALSDPQRVVWLKQILDANRLTGNQLTLEFHLSNAMAELRNLLAFNLAIKPLGITLSLSGFEANPTAYQLLQHVPVDYIKLAPRYAGIALRDSAVRDELQRIVAYAHERGKRVIAPRLEDAQSAVALSNAGVDYIQGDFVQQAGQELNYDFSTSVR